LFLFHGELLHIEVIIMLPDRSKDLFT